MSAMGPGRPWKRIASPGRRTVPPLWVSPLYGVYVTTLVTAVPNTPTPEVLSETADATLDLIRRLDRPTSVLELAARMDQIPVAMASAVAELVTARPPNSAPGREHRPARDRHTPTALRAPVRQVFAPSTAPAARWRAWTAPGALHPEPTLHHDLWLVVSGDETARRTLGPLAPVGPMHLPVTDTRGSVWYAAALDENAYTSMAAVCGLEEASSQWEWLTRVAAGALVITDGEKFGAARAQAAALAEHHVPTAVLVDTDRDLTPADDARVCDALGLAESTPVVYGRAMVRSDVDEAVRRLEER
ncbi:hypothetical protein ABZ234_08515 [Nocardiopsis sp. NPDC006198]|uniref:hypothetical protein n=1 Tax=Nocardiopsis sp. NPDC006198 TaxID=3154472 RepID=UPI0033A1355E